MDVGNQAFASDIAETIAAYEAEGAEESAYRAFIQLNNELADSSATTQLVLSYTPPRRITPEWDAALAGLIEWRLRQKDTPIPEWVEENTGLDVGHRPPWPSIRLIDPDINLVPGPFRRRGIWIEEGELDSV